MVIGRQKSFFGIIYYANILKSTNFVIINQ